MDLEDASCRARYLIRDRDGKFPALFGTIPADAGIETVLSGVRMPRMNSIMERWVQTCRRELLDRTLIWNQPHLLHVLGSSSSSTTGTGRIRASRTPARSSHCPCRSRLLTKTPAFTYDGATDSVEYFMSINMRLRAAWMGFSARTALLADRGNVDELRDRADAGDRFAALRLADVLAERGNLDEATQVLRPRADAGDRDAARDLAGLLADRGKVDELRDRADAGDRDAAVRLARVLADRGDLDELRNRTEAGDREAALRLADVLTDRGDLDGAAQVLRPRADTGDPAAAMRLADLLADRSDVEELRNRADVGDAYAAGQLVKVLTDRGNLDGLLTLVNAGDKSAGTRLPDLLAQQDRGEEAERLRRFGLNPDGSIAYA